MYYAKPIDGYEGTYEYHIKKVTDIFYLEIEKKRDDIKKILDSIDEDYNEFRKNTYLAVSMHDMGKLSKVFQEQMRKTLDKEKRIKYFRHEILSFAYMIFATQDYLKEETNKFPYHYLSVLSHHKRLDINLDEFARDRDKPDPWPVLTEEEYKYGIDLVLRLSDMDLAIRDNLKGFKFNSHSLVRFFQGQLVESSLIRFNKKREDLRIIYSLCKGMLQYCDWMASADQKPLYQNLDQKELRRRIRAKVESDGYEYKEILFHKECAETQGDLILIAPTGAGKTEASLLWAVNKENSRIIFLMPTMVTSNSIFSRLSSSYFARKSCGLAHSNSDVYFAINDEFSDVDNSKIRFELLKYKVFIPPVMISTVDQLLTSGFNLGQWALKEYALIGGSVIFDEIQAYDTFTLGLITATIKKIKKLQGRVMIMTATMPKFLLTHFQKHLNPQFIVAREFMDRRYNRWKYIDKQVDEILGYIKEQTDRVIKDEGKVAIVVNNIEKAKELYIDLSKNYKVLCLHSEFTMGDRIEKEKILESINDFNIVVATQVIEVSLDISFNTIFSECAPIDSLVQRAGRCNRKGDLKDSEFIVFDYSSISEKYVYKDQREILEKTREVVRKNQRYLSEYEIGNMVDQVYEEFDMYDENYYKALDIYDRIAREELIFDLKYDEEDLRTRLINNMKISIIPYKFKDEVENLFINKKYANISLFEVPVSVGRFKKYILKNYCDNPYKLPIYTIEYNDQTGVVYDDDSCKFI